MKRQWAICAGAQKIAFLIFLGILTGCTSLPDTSGYTASTIRLKSGVVSGGDAVKDQWTIAVRELPDGGASDQLQVDLERFVSSWKLVEISLTAMVNYAESIEGIVDAGNSGAQSARDVADAAKALLDTVKVLPQGDAATAIFGTVADAASFAYGEIAKARAAKRLEESLAKLGPAMEATTEIIAVLLRDARKLFLNVSELRINELDTEYGDLLRQKKELNQVQLGLTQLIHDELEKWSGDGDKTKSKENLEALRDRLGEAEKALGALNVQLAEYNTKKAQLMLTRKTGLALFGSTQSALSEWSASNQKLVKAVRDRKPVTMESLIAAANEIQSLVERIREI